MAPASRCCADPSHRHRGRPRSVSPWSRARCACVVPRVLLVSAPSRSYNDPMVSQRLSGLACVLALAACGGGDKKVKQPKPEKEVVVKPKKETEAAREAKRKSEREAIVPPGQTCLPPAHQETGAPQLALDAIGVDAVLCAGDTDAIRALVPVVCW